MIDLDEGIPGKSWHIWDDIFFMPFRQKRAEQAEMSKRKLKEPT